NIAATCLCILFDDTAITYDQPAALSLSAVSIAGSTGEIGAPVAAKPAQQAKRLVVVSFLFGKREGVSSSSTRHVSTLSTQLSGYRRPELVLIRSVQPRRSPSVAPR